MYAKIVSRFLDCASLGYAHCLDSVGLRQRHPRAGWIGLSPPQRPLDALTLALVQFRCFSSFSDKCNDVRRLVTEVLVDGGRFVVAESGPPLKQTCRRRPVPSLRWTQRYAGCSRNRMRSWSFVQDAGGYVRTPVGVATQKKTAVGVVMLGRQGASWSKHLDTSESAATKRSYYKTMASANTGTYLMVLSYMHAC